MILDYNYFKNKRILITGATGQIGYHIISKLIDVEDIEIIALGRNMEKLNRTFHNLEAKGILIKIQHNISEPLPKTLGHIDYIFHAASPISGEEIRKYPLDVIKSNLYGTINCLEYLKNQNEGKMIIFSSATVYPQNKEKVVFSEDQTGNAELLSSPTAPYSESKRMIEVIAQAYYTQYGINSLIVRFSYLYGFTPQPAKTAFFEFIGKALNGQNLRLQKSGLHRRDNIYIDDAIDALILLCSKGFGFEVFNISSNGDEGNYASPEEIAECIAKVTKKITGKDIYIEYASAKESPKEGTLLSNEKIRSLGWKIKTSLEEGIFHTLKKFHELQDTKQY